VERSRPSNDDQVAASNDAEPAAEEPSAAGFGERGGRMKPAAAVFGAIVVLTAIVSLIVLSVLGGGEDESAFRDHLVKHVPADATGFVYVNLRQLGEDLNAAAAKAALDVTTDKLVNDAVSFLKREAPGDREKQYAELLGDAWKALRGGNIGVAFLGTETRKTTWGEETIGHVLLFARVDSTFRKFFDEKLKKKIEEETEAKFTKKTVEGVEAHFLTGEDVEKPMVAYAWHGDLLMLGFPGSTVQRALAAAREGTGIKNNPDYRDLNPLLDKRGSIKGFINLDKAKGMIGRVRPALPGPLRPWMAAKAGLVERGYVFVVNLADGLSAGFATNALVDKIEQMPSWAAGLRRGDFELARYVPADVNLFAGVHLGDLNELFDHLKESESGIPASSTTTFADAVIERFGASRKELLGAVAGEIVAAAKVKAGPERPEPESWLVLMAVRDDSLAEFTRKVADETAVVMPFAARALGDGRIFGVADSEATLKAAEDAAKRGAFDKTTLYRKALAAAPSRQVFLLVTVSKELMGDLAGGAPAEYRETLGKLGPVTYSASLLGKRFQAKVHIGNATEVLIKILDKASKDALK